MGQGKMKGPTVLQVYSMRRTSDYFYCFISMDCLIWGYLAQETGRHLRWRRMWGTHMIVLGGEERKYGDTHVLSWLINIIGVLEEGMWGWHYCGRCCWEP